MGYCYDHLLYICSQILRYIVHNSLQEQHFQYKRLGCQITKAQYRTILDFPGDEITIDGKNYVCREGTDVDDLQEAFYVNKICDNLACLHSDLSDYISSGREDTSDRTNNCDFSQVSLTEKWSHSCHQMIRKCKQISPNLS